MKFEISPKNPLIFEADNPQEAMAKFIVWQANLVNQPTKIITDVFMAEKKVMSLADICNQKGIKSI